MFIPGKKKKGPPIVHLPSDGGLGGREGGGSEEGELLSHKRKNNDPSVLGKKSRGARESRVLEGGRDRFAVPENGTNGQRGEILSGGEKKDSR